MKKWILTIMLVFYYNIVLKHFKQTQQQVIPFLHANNSKVGEKEFTITVGRYTS